MKKTSCVMVKKFGFTLVMIVMCIAGSAQQPQKQGDIDTLFTDYDELFSELDLFLDSLLTPRNFTVINIGATTAFFNYDDNDSNVPEAIKKVLYTPSVSYFTRSGLGISASANIIRDDKQWNPYQYSATASYDYIKSRKLITGISYTRFFTKNDLSFYTSPLENGVSGYFTYRDFWVKPTVGINYGWGSRTAYSQREEKITGIRLKRRGYTTINTQESINDLNLIASARHDFYWLDVLSKNDFIRFTPQLTFTGGTQRFGINQNSNTYASVKGTGVNILYNTENMYLDDKTIFQPLSLTAFMKAEYSIGKVFLQPQLMLDYYFPAEDKNFTTAVLLNAGVIF